MSTDLTQALVHQLAEKDARIADLEARNERLSIALVAIQSTVPGSAHRIAIQALAECPVCGAPGSGCTTCLAELRCDGP